MWRRICGISTRYLYENQFIQSLREIHGEYQHILSKDVLAKIQSGDAAWETMVPARRGVRHQTAAAFRLEIVPGACAGGTLKRAAGRCCAACE